MNRCPQMNERTERLGRGFVARCACWILWWLAALMFTGPAGAAQATLSPAAFDAANKLYEQGKFHEAAIAYNQLLQTGGASTAVYFNLGNAYYKAGEIGRAIAAYRTAEQMDPRDPDLRANLQFARKQVQGPTLSPAALFGWIGRLSLNEWTWLAMGGLWVWLLLLALRQMRAKWRLALKPYTRLAGVAALVLCIGLGFTLHQERYSPTAIVSTPEAVIRQAPLEESQPTFTAHDGSELKVLDTKSDWLQVTSGENRFGWVRRDQVILMPAS